MPCYLKPVLDFYQSLKAVVDGQERLAYRSV